MYYILVRKREKGGSEKGKAHRLYTHRSRRIRNTQTCTNGHMISTEGKERKRKEKRKRKKRTIIHTQTNTNPKHTNTHKWAYEFN